MKKNIFFWVILLIFLTTYNSLGKNKNKLKFFQVKYIEIQGIENSNKQELKKELNIIKKKNIFFLKNSDFKKIVENVDFVDTIKIKKIYPDKIKVSIIESEPLAFYVNDYGKKYYLLENNKIVEEKNYNINNLPKVFGKSGINKFLNFYKSIKTTNLKLSLIKEFVYHDIGRWDILLNNKKILKLPPENFENSIVKFLQIYEKDNFKYFTVFDFRIKNELILK